MGEEVYSQRKNDYSVLEFGSISEETLTDFDIFLEFPDSIVLYGRSGYNWLKGEVKSLVKAGYKHALIQKNDRNKAAMYAQMSRLPIVDRDLDPYQRVKAIIEIGSEFVKYLYSGEITRSCVVKAGYLSDSITTSVREAPDCIKAMPPILDLEDYDFHHSIRVAIYGTAIANRMGLKDPDRLREIALGGIFHDIGKKNVEQELLNKRGALTDLDWQRMKSHPEFGVDALNQSPLNLVPQEIILHHHEKLDGSGYPHGLDKTELMPEVQIMTIADIFDAITSPRTYQEPRPQFDTLDYMKQTMIGPKLAFEPFKALISCLK